MIIFISGPLNSGKSTVAKILNKEIRGAAIVEPDAIREFIADVPIDKAVPIVLELAVLVVKRLAQARFNVIVPYPLSEKNYRFIRARLQGEKLHFFILNPRMEAITNGRGKRKLDRWEKQRIRRHYQINLHNPPFGIKIDNTKQKPKETANTILNSIK